jgi:hypothetical protein
LELFCWSVEIFALDLWLNKSTLTSTATCSRYLYNQKAVVLHAYSPVVCHIEISRYQTARSFFIEHQSFTTRQHATSVAQGGALRVKDITGGQGWFIGKLLHHCHVVWHHRIPARRSRITEVTSAINHMVCTSGGFWERPRAPPPFFFSRNLPSNVRKTQVLRSKIRECFAISGGFWSAPTFRNFWIRHCVRLILKTGGL